MPRVYDGSKTAAQRGAGFNSDHSPLAKLLNFQDLGKFAQLIGGLLRTEIQDALGQVLGVIAAITGVDLRPLADAFEGSILAGDIDQLSGQIITSPLGTPQYVAQFAAEAPAALIGLVASVSNVIGIGPLGTVLPQILGAFDGIDITSPGAVLAAIENAIATGAADFISIVKAYIPGYTGTTQSQALTDFTAIAGNLLSLMGSPSGILTGSPTLPGIGSIPLLGGLFSGGTILGSLIPFLDASKIISGVLGTGQIPTITASMTSGIMSFDNIVNGIYNNASTGNLLADAKSALQSIPNPNVQGNLGGVGIGNTIQNFLDSGVQAIQSDLSTLNSISSYQSAFTALTSFLGHHPNTPAPPPSSVSAMTLTANEFIAQQSVTNPLAHGIDPTVRGPFDLQMLLASAAGSLTTIPVTQGMSAIDFVQQPAGGPIQSLRWLGYPTGSTMANFVAFYANLYALNTSTGVSSLLYSSGNWVTSVVPGSTPQFNAHNMPSGSVQTLQLGGATGGDHTLTFGANTTGSISYTDSAATIQTALQGLASIGAGNILVTDVGGGNFNLRFTGSLAGTSQPLISMASSLTGCTSIPGVSNYVVSSQGNIYTLEIAVLGTGTYNLVGLTTNPFPTHPTAIPAKFAAARTVMPFSGANGVVAPGAAGNVGTIAHVFTATDNAVVVAVNLYTGATSLSAGNCTATCGGVSMTQKSFTTVQGSNPFEYQAIFSLINSGGTPFGAGSQNIVITTPSNAGMFMTAQSASYPGVTAIGTPQTASGNSATAAVTATGMADQIIFVAISSWGAGNITAFQQSGGELINNKSYSAGAAFPQEIGDLFGYAASIALSNTVTSGNWGIAAVPIAVVSTAGPNPTTIVNPTTAPMAYTDNIPWIGVASMAGTATYPPRLITIQVSATVINPTVTYPWANFFDVIVAGDGGGGASDGGDYGSDGAGSSLSIPGYGSSPIAAAGGIGGHSVSSAAFGAAMANEIFATHYGVNETYYGGAASSLNAVGNQPGGGGSGGYGGADLGTGGGAAVWNAATLTKAQMGSSNLTATIGTGGAGGPTVSGPNAGHKGGAGIIYILAYQ